MAQTMTQLKAYCLKNGWRDTTTDGLTQLGNFIQDTLFQLTTEFSWPFYRKTHTFNLTVPYTTGTVNLVEASTTVTGAGTADFSSGMASQLFYTGSDSERVYQIASVAASAETLTLASAYLGDTEDGATYAIRYVKYDLPTGFDRAGAMFVEDEREIQTDLTLEEWQQLIMKHRGTSATPTHCHIEMQADAKGFYMYPAPSTAKQVRCTYYHVPATMTSDAVETDWLGSYRFLLHAVLRIRMNNEMADVAALAVSNKEFQRLLARAITRSRPAKVPLSLPIGVSDRLTVEDLKARINITS